MSADVIDEWKAVTESLNIVKDKSYDDFNNYIKSLVWCDKKYISDICEIILVTDPREKIIEKKDKKLYISQSPFDIKLNNQIYPSGFMVEHLIKFLIAAITKNSKVNIKLRNKFVTKDEEEDDDNI